MIHLDGDEITENTGSTYNLAEAEMVIGLLQELQQKSRGGTFSLSSAANVRVITFYAAQVALIQTLARRAKLDTRISMSTVDSSQGSESDIVIVSFVRTGKRVSYSSDGSVSVNPRRAIGFLTDERRLNVALTRAKYQRICVGDAFHLATVRGADASAIRSFVEHMTASGKVVRDYVPDRHVHRKTPSFFQQ
jgi:superfamily I DNA and/or RNA helicase